jgi:hypothetical protein
LRGAPAKAAVVYATVVFGAGFALGTIRVLLAAPAVGELPAVLLETPLMLALSWAACGVCLRSFGVAGRGRGLAMGGTAFGLLMLAEFALSLFVFHRPPVDFVRALGTPAGAVGLIGQVAFGVFPAVRSAAAPPDAHENSARRVRM